MDDASLSVLHAGAGVIEQDLRDDALGQAAGGGHGGRGPTVEGELGVDDDGAFLQRCAGRHDPDAVLAAGNLQVRRDGGELEAFHDAVLAGVDIDGRGIAGAMQDANLGVLVLCCRGNG